MPGKRHGYAFDGTICADHAAEVAESSAYRI